MTNPVTSKSAQPSNINKLDITSNKSSGKNVSVTGGTVNLMYYESILQDSIRATVTFVDSGNAIDNKTALDGLPIVGQENVSLQFSDNNNNKLTLTLYVNKVTPMSDKSTKSMVELDLTSKEFIMNEKVRLNGRFDGKISDHIKKILTDKTYLGTQKKVDVEETSNNYNFIGNNRKPYYAMNWLCKKAISSQHQQPGKSAGYFFYETSEGFKFKSIDGLFAQEKKKSIVYNETPDMKKIPSGYDAKALDYQKDNRVDVQEKLQMGAFSTRSILFDPFSCYYEVIVEKANEKNLKLGGKELPVLNKEFDKEGKNKDFSKTTYYLLDKGTLPTGDTQQQIQKSGEENFDPKKVLNQAIRRYGQMFTGMQTITIAGDFSLHAGDAVFLDVPPVDASKSDTVNKESGGLYIIADLCHYVSTKETYTKLNLVRDSFGRKGNHTSGKIPL